MFLLQTYRYLQHGFAHSIPTGLVMRRNTVLAFLRVVRCWHNANELHHATIFVRENVAVKDVSADEVQIGLPDCDPAGCNVCNLIYHLF